MEIRLVRPARIGVVAFELGPDPSSELAAAPLRQAVASR